VKRFWATVVGPSALVMCSAMAAHADTRASVCARTSRGFEKSVCTIPLGPGFHDWRLHWTFDSYAQWDVEIRTDAGLIAQATCWVELTPAPVVPDSIPECTDLEGSDGQHYAGSGMHDGSAVGWHLWFSLPSNGVMTVVQQSPGSSSPARGSWIVIDQNTIQTRS